MAKIEFDKYYTPVDIARHCYNKAIEVIGDSFITDIIEPSAGAGVFLDLDKRIKGYDIKPEREDIIQQDYLELNLPYKEGRLIIGNPPYGRCLNLALKFFKSLLK